VKLGVCNTLLCVVTFNSSLIREAQYCVEKLWCNSIMQKYMSIKHKISKAMRGFFSPNILSLIIGFRLFLRPRRISYSQKGEDLIIRSYFRESAISRRGLKIGTYLDIGSWHPNCISNTALLHKSGWSGYAIDIDMYKLKFMKAVRREKVNIIHAAVTPSTSGYAEVYRFGTPGDWSDIDTLDKGAADFAVENWGTGSYQIDRINTIGINELLSQLPYINVLNIDIEGLDGPVIEALDIDRFPIDFILYEDNTGRNFDAVYKKLSNNGYKLLLNCGGAVAFGRIAPSYV